MLIVEPDFDRRIDLPGAGPCPRPVDIDRTKADLTRLVSLRVYSFAKGVAIDGEAEGDEVFIVLLRGSATIVIRQAGERAGDFSLGGDGFTRVIYMPPHASYRLAAVDDCDIAYARCEPASTALPPVRGFAAEGGEVAVIGHATGMSLALTRVAPSWSGDGEQAPERFVHVRSDAGGAVRIGGERLEDWGSAVLTGGDAATVEIETEPVEILTISASVR